MLQLNNLGLAQRNTLGLAQRKNRLRERRTWQLLQKNWPDLLKL